MNKKEFLNELQNALEGRLPEADISEIVSDYSDIFDNLLESGKGEADVAQGIGSPAKIARTILEDGMESGKKNSESDSSFSKEEKGGREYTDFQKNINEKTNKIFDKVIEPDQNVAIDRLTPMSRRLGAFVIDGLILGVLGIGLMLIFALPLFLMNYSSVSVSNGSVQNMAGMGGTMMGGNVAATGATFMNLILLALIFGVFSLFTTIFLWASNGYTPGKWILKMRVIKINGSKISFLDAVLREFIIKGIANSLLSGFLNIVSFIWGSVTDDHKTAHDLVAQTRVVNWDRIMAGKI